MPIEDFYNTTFNLTRQTWSGDSSAEVSKGSFSGHLQQLREEKIEQLGLDYSLAFSVWCDDSVNVQEGDILDDGTFTYSVEAVTRNNHNGENKHKELLVQRHRLPVSR